MTPDLNHFKNKLEAERDEVEKALAQVGRPNPQNKKDWEVTPIANEPPAEFRDEVAERLEAMDERTEIEQALEGRLNNILRALAKIGAGDGSFGRCEIGGEPIELDRLEANPAARTCKNHRAG